MLAGRTGSACSSTGWTPGRPQLTWEESTAITHSLQINQPACAARPPIPAGRPASTWTGCQLRPVHRRSDPHGHLRQGLHRRGRYDHRLHALRAHRQLPGHRMACIWAPIPRLTPTIRRPAARTTGSSNWMTRDIANNGACQCGRQEPSPAERPPARRTACRGAEAGTVNFFGPSTDADGDALAPSGVAGRFWAETIDPDTTEVDYHATASRQSVVGAFGAEKQD